MNKVVRNERLKYLAASYDRASTAGFAVGGIAPLTSILAGAVMPPDRTLFFGAVAPWVIVGVIPDRLGNALLGGLEE